MLEKLTVGALAINIPDYQPIFGVCISWHWVSGGILVTILSSPC